MKTPLNENITESYRSEYLLVMEKLTCKKRIKACVYLAQQDEIIIIFFFFFLCSEIIIIIEEFSRHWIT